VTRRRAALGLRVLVVACGLLVLMAACGLLALVVACGSRPATRPNLILVTIESLRPDHVGCYGGRSRTRPEVALTPALDALAAEGRRYTDAHAVTSWTLTSHASLFTGLYPATHVTVAPRDKLGDDFVTVAEALRAAGYQTAGVISGPYLRRPYGLDQGFDVWVDDIASLRTSAAHDDVTNPRVEAALGAFLDEDRDPERPFFLFAYLWDPHYDYLPPPPYDTMFVSPECEPIDLTGYGTNPIFTAGISDAQLAHVLSQYAGEIRATDDMLGRLFAKVRAAGLWDDTAIVVTADHGEEFFEHGKVGHKNTVYDESVHVPLIVKFPGGDPAGVDERLVSLVDLYPTLLDLAGVAPPAPHHGRSLLAAPQPERAIFHELLALRYLMNDEQEIETSGAQWRSIRQGSWKLVWEQDLRDESRHAIQLFDVARDPGEQRSLSEQETARVQALAEAMVARLERFEREATGYEPGGRVTLDDTEVQRLRALGYLVEEAP